MADKVEALVEGELGRIPAQLKPFFQKGAKDDPDQIFMNLGYMAYAYGRAFTNFAEGALEDWPKKNYIIQPMVWPVIRWSCISNGRFPTIKIISVTVKERITIT